MSKYRLNLFKVDDFGGIEKTLVKVKREGKKAKKVLIALARKWDMGDRLMFRRKTKTNLTRGAFGKCRNSV